LGDVLVTTPLIYGLKKAFPNSKITVGVGDWSSSLLENNRDIDEIISLNGPWHNKQNCYFPANSLLTFIFGLLYVLFSREARCLTKQNFTVGIDVLGSRQGCWLLRRAGIPNRFGVKGYAGGHKWCKKNIEFSENKNVAKSALSFLPLLGSNIQIEPRPRIFLTERETKDAVSHWNISTKKFKRIVVAPGGGFPEKCWGDRNFSSLIITLLKEKELKIFVVGNHDDERRINLIENERLKNFCGKLNLRESAAIISQSEFVITNSSLSMHLAGAFKIPSLTLLGDWYGSAKSHRIQWGYDEGVVLGKEISEGKRNIPSVNTAVELIKERLLLN